MMLSFLSVPVIPQIRLPDIVLIEVSRQRRISLFVD